MDCVYSADEIQLKLLETFPLLLPQNNDFSQYDGFINIGKRQFRLTLEVPNYPSAHGVQLHPNWKLEAFLTSCTTALNKLPGKCASVLQYLREFKAMLETCESILESEVTGNGIQGKNTSSELRSVGSDDLILSHLRLLGFNHVSSLEADFHTVSLIATDDWDNIHEMSLKISQNYPTIVNSKPLLTVVNTDLPKAICELIQKESNIIAAYNCFSQQLHNLSSIWNQLQFLDSKAWVIDPTHPKKSDMYRRILIDAPKVMAQITWNPLHPLSKPDIIFQGAEEEVESFRNIYESHLEEWSDNCDILVNICRVLNLSQLPVKESLSDDVDMMQETGECCICMSVELNGAFPCVSCGQCLSCFHAVCLFQWLEMLGKSRIVHNHISGDCPNCDAEIKCPDPNSTDMT